MDLDLAAPLDLGLDRLTSLFNRSFAGYLVDVDLGVAAMGDLVRVDSVDLVASRVIHEGGKELGIALIARRGWTSRIAAMGIVPEARGRKVGTWFMEQLVREARDRGDRSMVLEVIEQNTPAVRLYRKSGFLVRRRLVGYVGTGIEPRENVEWGDLEEVDPLEVARLVAAVGAEGLPWQLSSDNLLGHAPPSRAFRLGPAHAILSDPDQENVALAAILVVPEERRKGNGTSLIRALARRFPDRIWGVRVVLPEDLCLGFFESLGFVRSNLTQFEMDLTF